MNFIFQKIKEEQDRANQPAQIQLEIPLPPPHPAQAALPGKAENRVAVIDLYAEEEDSEGVVFIRW
jgi:hypothetical protein